jgi:amidophosphoribosyltransferase
LKSQDELELNLLASGIPRLQRLWGADSLAFLTIDGMYRAMGEPGRDPANPKFSDHCFTGVYPTHLTDQTQVEPQPRQLSLLAEAS